MAAPLPEPVPGRGRNPLLYIMIALVLVLAAVAVWLVVTWVKARDDRAAATEAQARASAELARAESDDSIEFTRVRDEVRRAGDDGILVFHEIDHRRAAAAIDKWEQASTGALHDEIVSRRETSRQTIEQAGTVATATVLSSTVTDLDVRAGTATMLAAVKVDVAQQGQQPTAKYLRIQASLQRTDSGWKLSGIGQVDIAST